MKSFGHVLVPNSLTQCLLCTVLVNIAINEGSYVVKQGLMSPLRGIKFQNSPESNHKSKLQWLLHLIKNMWVLSAKEADVNAHHENHLIALICGITLEPLLSQYWELGVRLKLPTSNF